MQETKVLGIRFSGSEQMGIYKQVQTLANKNKLFMSEAGKLLINRGLHHTNNPEPLIKKDTPKETPLSYINRHYKTEHIGEDPKTQQLLSGDKLKTGDKASSSHNALEVEKSPPVDRNNPWLTVGLIGLGVYVIYKVYTILK